LDGWERQSRRFSESPLIDAEKGAASSDLAGSDRAAILLVAEADYAFGQSALSGFLEKELCDDISLEQPVRRNSSAFRHFVLRARPADYAFGSSALRASW
jgi:hypothetical protein